MLKYCAEETLNLADYIGMREWSPTGDMLHLHFAGWCKDAPRCAKVAADLKAKKQYFRDCGVSLGILESYVTIAVINFSMRRVLNITI